MYRVHGKDGQMYEAPSLAILQQWVSEGRVISGTIVEDLLSGTEGPASGVAGLKFPAGYRTASAASTDTAGTGQVGLEQGRNEGFAGDSGSAYPPEGSQAVPDLRVHIPLIKAIISTLCCSPIGVIAVVYAAKVPEIVAQGDLVRAREAVRRANMWANIALVSGIAFQVIFFKYGKSLGLLGDMGTGSLL